MRSSTLKLTVLRSCAPAFPSFSIFPASSSPLSPRSLHFQYVTPSTHQPDLTFQLNHSTGLVPNKMLPHDFNDFSNSPTLFLSTPQYHQSFCTASAAAHTTRYIPFKPIMSSSNDGPCPNQSRNSNNLSAATTPITVPSSSNHSRKRTHDSEISSYDMSPPGDDVDMTKESHIDRARTPDISPVQDDFIQLMASIDILVGGPSLNVGPTNEHLGSLLADKLGEDTTYVLPRMGLLPSCAPETCLVSHLLTGKC